ncbi:MAG: glycosyltransferase family 2 protein, partial [Clostridium sp.]|nr:glycosyltransferase family 2 protein [Clostridium sp.]
MKSLVIIPAYNEEKNIGHTLADLRQHCPDCDCLVVNDCSRDRTKEILVREGVTFLDLPVNLGIGGGVQAGYRFAERNGYDIAVQFDGDGQHEAKYIRALLEPLEKGEADVVIGSRFVEKKGFQSSAMRRVGIDFLSQLIFRIGGVRVRDVTSGMRAVNRKMIALYAEKYAQDYPEPEAVMQAGLAGARVAEIP